MGLVNLSSEFANYPKLRISVEGGDLVDAYDVQLSCEDGETLVHTLKQNPAGSTGGKRGATVTWKNAVSESGLERPYWKNYLKRKTVTVRLKVANVTLSITGRLTTPTMSGNLDSFTDNTWTIKGRLSIS